MLRFLLVAWGKLFAARTGLMAPLGLAACLAGCVVVARRPARSEVAYPPPQPASEAPVVCDPGYARVPGHWRWNGYQYVWVPQRCVYRPGYRWQPGGYYQCGDGWCFQEGGWVQAGP
jgi:hypothetical protein